MIRNTLSIEDLYQKFPQLSQTRIIIITFLILKFFLHFLIQNSCRVNSHKISRVIGVNPVNINRFKSIFLFFRSFLRHFLNTLKFLISKIFTLHRKSSRNIVLIHQFLKHVNVCILQGFLSWYFLIENIQLFPIKSLLHYKFLISVILKLLQSFDGNRLRIETRILSGNDWHEHLFIQRQIE